MFILFYKCQGQCSVNALVINDKGNKFSIRKTYSFSSPTVVTVHQKWEESFLPICWNNCHNGRLGPFSWVMVCLHHNFRHNSGKILPSPSLHTVSLSCSSLGFSKLLKYQKLFNFISYCPSFIMDYVFYKCVLWALLFYWVKYFSTYAFILIIPSFINSIPSRTSIFILLRKSWSVIVVLSVTTRCLKYNSFVFSVKKN